MFGPPTNTRSLHHAEHHMSPLRNPHRIEPTLHPDSRERLARELSAALGQSRRGSVIEIACSTAFGFFIATWANVLILPIFGYNVTTLHAIGMGAIFTAISLARGYVFRRAFEYLRIKGIVP